jgi:hypothetical protein
MAFDDMALQILLVDEVRGLMSLPGSSTEKNPDYRQGDSQEKNKQTCFEQEPFAHGYGPHLQSEADTEESQAGIFDPLGAGGRFGFHVGHRIASNSQVFCFSVKGTIQIPGRKS